MPAQQTNYTPWVIAAGVGLAYFGVLDPLMKKLGIKKDDNEILVDDTINQGSAKNPFDPNFWRVAPAGALLLHNYDGFLLCDKIYRAFGPVNDDEETPIGVIRGLKTQSQVSYLSYLFLQRYGQDLLTFLKGGNWPEDRLSAEDVATIIRVVKDKPPYTL